MGKWRTFINHGVCHTCHQTCIGLFWLERELTKLELGCDLSINTFSLTRKRSSSTYLVQECGTVVCDRDAAVRDGKDFCIFSNFYLYMSWDHIFTLSLAKLNFHGYIFRFNIGYCLCLIWHLWPVLVMSWMDTWSYISWHSHFRDLFAIYFYHLNIYINGLLVKNCHTGMAVPYWT